VGTFQPYEGLDLLIRAMPQVLARRPTAHLLMWASAGEYDSRHRAAGARNCLGSVRTSHLQPAAARDDQACMHSLTSWCTRLLTRTAHDAPQTARSHGDGACRREQRRAGAARTGS
jgi:hypothetical protein